MGILPDIRLPLNASDEELQSLLADGSLLCRILNKLKPGCVPKVLTLIHYISCFWCEDELLFDIVCHYLLV